MVLNLQHSLQMIQTTLQTAEFRDWALEILNKENEKEIEDRKKIHETRCKAVLDTQKQIDELTRMRYRGLIGDDVFRRELKQLQSQLASLKQCRSETEDRADKWLDLTEKPLILLQMHVKPSFMVTWIPKRTY